MKSGKQKLYSLSDNIVTANETDKSSTKKKNK